MTSDGFSGVSRRVLDDSMAMVSKRNVSGVRVSILRFLESVFGGAGGAGAGAGCGGGGDGGG